jgi:hypothetical protein
VIVAAREDDAVVRELFIPVILEAREDESVFIVVFREPIDDENDELAVVNDEFKVV